MRKYLIGAIVGALLMVSFQVFAEDGLTKIEAYLRPDLPVTFNGAKVTLESSPVMYEGNTYLKLRDISKLMDVNVGWNEQTQTVMLSTYGSAEQPGQSKPIPPAQPSPEQPKVVGGKLDYKNTTKEVAKTKYGRLDAIITDGQTYASYSDLQLLYMSQDREIDVIYNNKTREITFLKSGAIASYDNEDEILFYQDSIYINARFLD